MTEHLRNLALADEDLPNRKKPYCMNGRDKIRVPGDRSMPYSSFFTAYSIICPGSDS
jgi:hypothetical protein